MLQLSHDNLILYSILHNNNIEHFLFVINLITRTNRKVRKGRSLKEEFEFCGTMHYVFPVPSKF